MLTLGAACIAFAIVAGIVAWQANGTTHATYHALVDQGSVSVDAALQARAAVLDQMGAAATYLATTGTPRSTAQAFADRRWADFREASRISWSNLSDPVQGEGNVFRAADAAASDYIQQIGAMFAYVAANQPDAAGTAFLTARETLNTRLIPALNGLEAVKVEDMESTYANAANQIQAWRWALIGTAVLFALFLLGGLAAVRRMHYIWSWPLGLALLLTLGLTWGLQSELQTATADIRVMVREAYDNVAGVQDLAALMSQERALESIAIFDPTHAATRLTSFDQYNFLVEQTLCGDSGCTATPFLDASGNVDPGVLQTALTGQVKFGLPRAPLIANVHFAGQAQAYETLRADYRKWLQLHGQLASDLQQNQPAAARDLSTGALDQAFTQVVADADALRQIARTPFDQIASNVATNSTLAQNAAALFPLAGLLGAWGVWRRRSELFV